MFPVLYNDLTKPTADFIKKDYPETFKLETTAKHPLGSIVSTVETSNGSVTGTLQPKFDLAQYVKKPATANFTVDTKSLKKAEFNIEKIIPGLKTIITVDNKSLVQVENQYKRDRLALTLVAKKDQTFNAGLVFVVNPNITIGVQGEHKGSVKAANATVVLKPHKDLFITVGDKFLDQQLALSALYRYSGKFTFGGDATITMKSGTSVSYNIGSQYQIDGNSFLKAKINNKNKVNVAYQVAFNPSTKVTAGWNIDAKNLKEGNTFGASINVTL